MRSKYFLIVILLIVCSNDHFIQRASSDYFPLKEGYWWRYASGDDTLIIDVDSAETILQIECFPVSVGGYLRYLTKNSKSLNQYIKIVYNFSGDDYTIIEGFITRIELPLIKSNVWEDSLVDSLNISGQWIKAKYYTRGEVVRFSYLSDYDGDVYTIELQTIEILTLPDTTVIDTIDTVEDYAPGIGLVRYDNEEGEYILIEYEID